MVHNIQLLGDKESTYSVGDVIDVRMYDDPALPNEAADTVQPMVTACCVVNAAVSFPDGDFWVYMLHRCTKESPDNRDSRAAMEDGICPREKLALFRTGDKV